MSMTTLHTPTTMHPATDPMSLWQAVAYVAASLMTRKVYLTVEHPGTPSAVYSGEVNQEIQLLDVRRDAQVTGTYDQGAVTVLDERTGQRAEFTLTGNTFRGQRHAGTGPGVAFHGSIDRERVFLFDDALKARQVFTVRPERTNARQPMTRPPLGQAS